MGRHEPAGCGVGGVPAAAVQIEPPPESSERAVPTDLRHDRCRRHYGNVPVGVVPGDDPGGRVRHRPYSSTEPVRPRVARVQEHFVRVGHEKEASERARLQDVELAATHRLINLNRRDLDRQPLADGLKPIEQGLSTRGRQ